MTIHTRKLPQFALYAAHADEFGVTVFGSCYDEAVNNLADELAARSGQVMGQPARQPLSLQANAGGGSGQLATERNQP